MFNRHSSAIAALMLAALICALPVAAQVNHLFESKDHYTGPVANKVAEFKEDYYPAALAFNGDGSQLAVHFMVATDGVHVWNWREPKASARILKYPGGPGDGGALAYTPDGTLLAVRHNPMDDGRVIRVWNAQSGELEHDVVQHEGKGATHGMGFSPDGQLIALAIDRFIREPGNQILVFRTNTWESAWGLRTSPFQPTLVAFSPGGKFLALGGEVGPGSGTLPKPKILILDIVTRQIVETIDAPFPGAISAQTLAWSPNGLHIAAGCNVGGDSPGPDAVKIFEVATGKPIAKVSAKSATLTGLSYSPDGRYLIAGSVDDSVRILDGHDYTLLQKIPGDGRSVAVSRDSRYLAIAASPKISVWELK